MKNNIINVVFNMVLFLFTGGMIHCFLVLLPYFEENYEYTKTKSKRLKYIAVRFYENGGYSLGLGVGIAMLFVANVYFFPEIITGISLWVYAAPVFITFVLGLALLVVGFGVTCVASIMNGNYYINVCGKNKIPPPTVRASSTS